MTDKTEFAVYSNNETVAQSFYKDFVTGTMVAFCVYISQDSTWWTFITGLMFLIFIFGKLAVLLKNNQKKFRTKKELQAWVDTLPNS